MEREKKRMMEKDRKAKQKGKKENERGERDWDPMKMIQKGRERGRGRCQRITEEEKERERGGEEEEEEGGGGGRRGRKEWEGGERVILKM